MNSFNESYRFGSADWSDRSDLHRAGLLNPPGVMLGYDGSTALWMDGDASILTAAGTGTGKLRDQLAYTVCGVRGPDGSWQAPRRMLVNDCRGELAAISIHNQIRLGKPAYFYNPYGLHGLPQHRVQPWDMLKVDSPAFHADVKIAINDVITLSGGDNAQYFELKAREWSEAIAKHHVQVFGSVTMPQLYELLNQIEEPSGWDALAESMLRSPFGDVRRVAAEMDNKRVNSPREYGSIVGELFKSFNFLTDPRIRESLSASDFSLEVLCQQDCTVYIMIPAEYAQSVAPAQRALFGGTMLYKQRHPSAPRVTLVVDEAAQLGRFEGLLRAYSYGRGLGIRAWSIWQNTGQIVRNFGPEALSSFLAASQTRQFFGVRDLITAQMVSAMLGTQTLEYDAELDQAAARKNKAQIVQQVLGGADPFEAGFNFGHQSRAAITRTKQARALMTPDEILNMPEDEQLLFISGLDLHPIRAKKYPYYTRREMAGAYLPNPYHPPGDSVPIAGRFFSHTARVITERVPSHLSHWPQYQSGYWSYVEGYRPA